MENWDWTVIATIAATVGAAILGAWLLYAFERRPRVIWFWGHISKFEMRDPTAGKTVMHFHNIIVRNIGRKTAINVRLGHENLTDFDVFPSVEYTTKSLVNDRTEILFPTLVPGEQVVITYFYPGHMTFDRVNIYVKSDEGYAQGVGVNLLPVQPIWMHWGNRFIFTSGIIFLIYLLYKLAEWAIRTVW